MNRDTFGVIFAINVLQHELRRAGLDKGATVISLAHRDELMQLRAAILHAVPPAELPNSRGLVEGGDEFELMGVRFVVENTRRTPLRPVRPVGEIGGITIYVDDRLAPDAFVIRTEPGR